MGSQQSLCPLIVLMNRFLLSVPVDPLWHSRTDVELIDLKHYAYDRSRSGRPVCIEDLPVLTVSSVHGFSVDLKI